jgi:hypothetical protein
MYVFTHVYVCIDVGWVDNAGLGMLYGPNPTPEHKKKVREGTKSLSSNL